MRYFLLIAFTEFPATCSRMNALAYSFLVQRSMRSIGCPHLSVMRDQFIRHRDQPASSSSSSPEEERAWRSLDSWIACVAVLRWEKMSAVSFKACAV
jgi:hypothetical protein